MSNAQQDALSYQCPVQAFAGRVILVPGAGDGIGRTVSLALARNSANMILLGRTQEKLDAVYDKIKAADGPEPAMAPVNLDVARPQDYEALAVMFDKEFVRLDGIFHYA